MVASWIAEDRGENGHYFTSRITKTAFYAAIIELPIGHALSWMLLKVFEDWTSLDLRLYQIYISTAMVRINRFDVECEWRLWFTKRR